MESKSSDRSLNRPVIMTLEEWERVFDNIQKRERPSVYLIRSKMQKVLGFTVRSHNEWDKDSKNTHTIRLDFYNAEKRTMFLLKYGNGKD